MVGIVGDFKHLIPKAKSIHKNRGKEAERLLENHLRSLCVSQEQAWYRFPDAHAGSNQPTLADFGYLNKGTMYLIECKQVAHDYRLPHSNFAVDQVSRLRMWGMAGATPLVLVYHSNLKLWRGYGLNKFLTREGGSWDLRDTHPTTLKELL